MGGGKISKSKFVSENGKPVNFFRLCGVISNQTLNWICGGYFFGVFDALDYLANNENVGLVVSLTIEQIKSGRNINHVPFNHEETEWIDGDMELEKQFGKFEILHVPITDTGFITEKNAIRLIEEVQKYHKNNPNKSVYFHCWTGKGKTLLAIVYVLMKMYDIDSEKVVSIVKHYNTMCRLSEYQYQLLKGNKMSAEQLEVYMPIIKTSLDHKCYKINVI